MTGEPISLQAPDGGPLEARARRAGTRPAVRRLARTLAGLVQRSRLDTFDRRLRSGGLVPRARGHQGRGKAGAGPHERAVLDRGGAGPALAGASPTPCPRVRSVTRSLRSADIRALAVVAEEKRRVQRLELRNADGKIVVRLDIDEPAGGGASPASDGDGPRAARVRRPGPPRRGAADRLGAAARPPSTTPTQSTAPATGRRSPTATRRPPSCSLRRSAGSSRP